TSCACGWERAERPRKGGTKHPMHMPCKVSDCSTTVSGDDRLCDYHRALRGGPDEVARYREAARGLYVDAIADFRDRHQNDVWGSMLRVADAIAAGKAHPDDRQELLDFLKRQARTIGKPPEQSPENPDERAERIEQAKQAAMRRLAELDAARNAA
ncbi:MAG: hypothetical protein AB7P97_21950, partial [Hyphomonadaceae bacterium]